MLIVVAAVRAKMHAWRERVVRDVARDVRPRDDRLHVRPRLRLGERERPRAGLSALGLPLDGKVAVQVEALEGGAILIVTPSKLRISPSQSRR